MIPTSHKAGASAPVTGPAADTGGLPAPRSTFLARIPRAILRLEGGDVFDFLHRMTTNELRDLPDGAVATTFVVNEKGRTLDLVTIARWGSRAYLAGGAGAASVLADWLRKFIIADDVAIVDAGEYPSLPVIHGPDAPEYINALPPTLIGVREDLGAVPGLLIIDAEGTGPDSPTVLPAPIEALPRLTPEEYEAIRIAEMHPAFGRELGPETNVLETGLRRYISFSKGCYIGQEVVARMDTYRRLQRTIGLFRVEPGPGMVPRPGPLLRAGREVGRITSLALVPASGGWIALGYRQIAEEGRDFDLVVSQDNPPVRCICISNLPQGYEHDESET